MATGALIISISASFPVFRCMYMGVLRPGPEDRCANGAPCSQVLGNCFGRASSSSAADFHPAASSSLPTIPTTQGAAPSERIPTTPSLDGEATAPAFGGASDCRSSCRVTGGGRQRPLSTTFEEVLEPNFSVTMRESEVVQWSQAEEEEDRDSDGNTTHEACGGGFDRRSQPLDHFLALSEAQPAGPPSVPPCSSEGRMGGLASSSELPLVGAAPSLTSLRSPGSVASNSSGGGSRGGSSLQLVMRRGGEGNPVGRSASVDNPGKPFAGGGGRRTLSSQLSAGNPASRLSMCDSPPAQPEVAADPAAAVGLVGKPGGSARLPVVRSLPSGGHPHLIAAFRSTSGISHKAQPLPHSSSSPGVDHAATAVRRSQSNNSQRLNTQSPNCSASQLAHGSSSPFPTLVPQRAAGSNQLMHASGGQFYYAAVSGSNVQQAYYSGSNVQLVCTASSALDSGASASSGYNVQPSSGSASSTTHWRNDPALRRRRVLHLAELVTLGGNPNTNRGGTSGTVVGSGTVGGGTVGGSTARSSAVSAAARLYSQPELTTAEGRGAAARGGGGGGGGAPAGTISRTRSVDGPTPELSGTISRARSIDRSPAAGPNGGGRATVMSVFPRQQSGFSTHVSSASHVIVPASEPSSPEAVFLSGGEEGAPGDGKVKRTNIVS